MDSKDLLSLTEDGVAALLGVSRRMVRKYQSKHGLPCNGEGRARRFEWTSVLEWYLPYRIDIAQKGGGQSGKLGVKLVQFQDAAETKGRREAEARSARWAARRERGWKARLAKAEETGGLRIRGRRLQANINRKIGRKRDN